MKTAIIISVFALAVLVFFSDVIFGPSVLLDASPFAFHPWRSHASPEDLQYGIYRMDGLLTYLPRQVELSRSFRSGRFPLWNPYIYAGIPFFADPQARVVYPTTALLAWMDPAKAMGYDIAIHFFIAMLGMYLFLRAVGTSTSGSVVGAFAYGFSSFFYCRLGQPTFIASASWIPFFFYAYERAGTSERTGTLLLIVYLALGYLAGFPQIFMLGVGGLIIYAITLNVDRMITRRPADWLRSLRVLAISGICSMLLVSVQLVSFLEFIRHAVGLNIEFEKMRDVYLSPPILLVKSFFPDLFGNPVAGTDWSGLMRATVHPYNPDFIVYCGIGCALVALGGLVFLRRARRMRALVVLLLMSIGLATSPLLLRIAYALLPVFRYSRVARVGVLGCFALAALGGMTLSMLSREANSRSRRPFLRVVLAGLAVIIVGSLVFMAAGDSYIQKMTAKANSLGPEFWRSALAQLRSGRIREWADGEASRWFAYVKGRLLFGLAFGVLAAMAVSVYAWPRQLGANPRRLALVAFALVLLLDLGLVSRGYFVTQPSGSFPEVDGIGVLRAGLGVQGGWRTRSVSYNPEYVSTLPGNANQILKIHSLEGTSTIVPANYYDGLLKSFDDSLVPARLRKNYLPFEPEEIRLSDLACVRYVAAEGTQAPYVSSPVFRTVIEGLAGRPFDREAVRLLTLGNDTRPALRQEVNEALTFSIRIPEVSRLDFAIGFGSGGGTMGDSLTFLLMLEGRSERIEFARGFNLFSDRNRWHDVSLDISAISGGLVKGAIGVIFPGREAPDGITAGWSGMDLVFEDCAIDTLAGRYRIDIDGSREFLSLTLRSDAPEIPLSLSLGEGRTRIRWIGFPRNLPVRHLTADLAEATAETILIESDSTFVLDGARTVYLGSVYPDYRLIHDSDMHIYENSAAVEKGICIDKAAVSVRETDGRLVLGLAGMEEIGAARCGRCRIVSYEPEQVVLEVEAERDCYLLFQDMYYPGWTAVVDSVSREFVRADVGFRVLEIPEGNHSVVMEFRPGSLRLGLALTCLGLLLTLVYAWRSRSCPGEGGSPGGTGSSGENRPTPEGHPPREDNPPEVRAS